MVTGVVEAPEMSDPAGRIKAGVPWASTPAKRCVCAPVRLRAGHAVPAMRTRAGQQ
jgi:hypothetical protein